MSTVGAVGSSDARSRACILCAHHPDILYLSFNNCYREVCICVCCTGAGGEAWGHLGDISVCEIMICPHFIEIE